MSRTVEATIHGYGWVSWADLHRALLNAGAVASWADYDGFHIGEAPMQAPPYSHLWAWNGNNWALRARIEGDRAVVGLLAIDGPGPDIGKPIGKPQRVTCVVNDVESWPAKEERVSEQHPNVAGQRFRLYQTSSENPLTFVVAAV